MKSIKELEEIRQRTLNNINMRKDSDSTRIVVGMATCGIAAGARNTLNAIIEEIEAKHITNAVVSQTGCIGICKYEPIVEVFAPGAEKVTYVHVDPERARQIIASHIMNGTPITEYTYSYAVKEN